MARMPRLHWLAIVYMLQLSIRKAQETRTYEKAAALRFIESHGRDTLEIARGGGL